MKLPISAAAFIILHLSSCIFHLTWLDTFPGSPLVLCLQLCLKGYNIKTECFVVCWFYFHSHLHHYSTESHQQFYLFIYLFLLQYTVHVDVYVSRYSSCKSTAHLQLPSFNSFSIVSSSQSEMRENSGRFNY